MNELHLESYAEENIELEKYLSNAIISYGIEQLNGRKPKRQSCCYRDKNGRIVAGVTGSATLNLFFISHLFVETEYRNNGLGTKLLSEIEKIAVHAGCNILRLNTFNKKAHNLYLNAGFEKTTPISNYMKGFDLMYYHKQVG